MQRPGWAPETIDIERPSVARMYDSFQLVEPGLVWVPQWRPEPGAAVAQPELSVMLGGVGQRRG